MDELMVRLLRYLEARLVLVLRETGVGLRVAPEFSSPNHFTDAHNGAVAVM
jgi:hypothetical protein